MVDDKRYAFHMLPSGIVNPNCMAVIGTVLNVTHPFPWFFFFSVRLLSVLHGHSGFFIPATTANDLRHQRISIPNLPFFTIFSQEPISSWKGFTLCLQSLCQLTSPFIVELKLLYTLNGLDNDG